MGYKIAFVDDHKMLIDMLADSMLRSRYIDEVEKYYDGYDFLKEYKTKNFDLVVLDLRMPSINGLEVVEKIRQSDNDLKIMIMSGVEGEGAQRVLEKKGINGLVTKYNHIDVIKSAIVSVASGENIFLDDYIDDIDADLSLRELEVIKYLSQELRTTEIAEKLSISENTVKTHRKHIMNKIGAKNIVSIVNYAHRHSLV